MLEILFGAAIMLLGITFGHAMSTASRDRTKGGE